METRGLKTLFAGAVSSILPLVTLQSTLFLIAPILGFDVATSEGFLETMTMVINVGLIGGSMVSLVIIDKISISYYLITFMISMGCHFMVYLTSQQEEEFNWLVLGVSLSIFSTICQFKVIIRAAIYEMEEYGLGLIPFCLAGITFGNILGVGMQFFILRRFPLRNTVAEKKFLMYIWIYSITVLILSAKMHIDTNIEVHENKKILNKDKSISLFTDYWVYHDGFTYTRKFFNAVALYFTSLTLDSFFIPGSVNIVTDTFHHVRDPWNRHSLLLTYYVGFFSGCVYVHAVSRTEGNKTEVNEGMYNQVPWKILWIFLLCVRLPIGILYLYLAHNIFDIQHLREIVMYLSISGTILCAMISGAANSFALAGLYSGVMDTDIFKTSITVNKARVALATTLYFGNYIRFIVSWIARTYLTLFSYVITHHVNGNMWPTARETNEWNKFKWWVKATLAFLKYDIRYVANILYTIMRDLFRLLIEQNIQQ